MPGDNVTFRIDIESFGSGELETLAITDMFPSDLTFITGSEALL